MQLWTWWTHAQFVRLTSRAIPMGLSFAVEPAGRFMARDYVTVCCSVPWHSAIWHDSTKDSGKHTGQSSLYKTLADGSTSSETLLTNYQTTRCHNPVKNPMKNPWSLSSAWFQHTSQYRGYKTCLISGMTGEIHSPDFSPVSPGNVWAVSLILSTTVSPHIPSNYPYINHPVTRRYIMHYISR